ncbi:Dyp-type peroxidase [Chitinimonas sp.]|uniref:Dyp-type peroxidase n=1 Tax=Chitinimonas sp. TaxID=1934313 RepID=UPI0035AF60B5
MSQALAQSAICASSHLHALFLSFDLLPGTAPASARQSIARLAMQLADWERQHDAERCCWAIAIGCEQWGALLDRVAPRELAPFPQFADAIHPLPSTPHAVFVHLRSERHDLCFAAGELARIGLAEAFSLSEAIPGFRYLDARDLTGFVDGTENPVLEERPAVALIDDEAGFIGGSYLHVQRFVHDLPKWQALPVTTQEQVIGRSKLDDIEMDDAVKPASAHIARVVIEEDGQELEIVRQSMPYGTVGGEQGLMFISYCKTPAIFTRMLANMVTARDGHSDNLLRFTRAVSGAAYFVPPLPLLLALAD